MFKAKDRVEHKRYGFGEVREDEFTLSANVVVDFDSGMSAVVPADHLEHAHALVD